MIRAAVLALGVFAVAGCDGTTGAATTAPKGEGTVARRAADAADTRWAQDCPIPSDAPRGPIGRTAAALVARYGPADRDDRFVLGQAIDPVRMSVRNALPQSRDLQREIREMTWQVRGCALTVWLAERGSGEVAVHTMRAPAGGES